MLILESNLLLTSVHAQDVTITVDATVNNRIVSPYIYAKNETSDKPVIDSSAPQAPSKIDGYTGLFMNPWPQVNGYLLPNYWYTKFEYNTECGPNGEQLNANGFSTQKTGIARNPIIFADVPDMSIVRIGNTYYMSSTTMHMSPGVPIMKSNDLVNWQIVNYAYDILDNVDELMLNNGKNAYGKGTWASSIRYHKIPFTSAHFRKQPERLTYFRPVISKKDPGKYLLSARVFTTIPCFSTMMAVFI